MSKSDVERLKEINLNIVSEYPAVQEINKTIRQLLSDDSVEAHVCNAVEICLTEALNNIIKHAYSGNNDKVIDVTLRKDTNYLEFELRDEGIPREKLVINDLSFDPNDIEGLPESGMGLFIIKQLMDEINYYSLNGKNYFTLKKWLY